MTVDERAAEVLVAHQRMDKHALSWPCCLCGWNELGRSHAEHQVKMLREAGVLNN